MKKHRNLVVDLNNLVFSTRFAKIKTPSSMRRKEEYIPEMIFKDTLLSIVKYANEFKSDAIAIACDSSKVWRKEIYPEYKANRDHADIYYEETIEAANMLKRFFKECTNVAVFEVPHTEADDIIAVIAAESGEGVENVILSSDRDFVQLINENTFLFSPAQGKWRETEDAAYDLFFKCIRGDSNDNIFSAYPRVWEKKLVEAWEDEYKMLNLMETVRKDGVKVGDAYALNKKLIDLTAQPPLIRAEIEKVIKAPFQRKFGELRMQKWLADNSLKKFSNMLQFKERPLKGRFTLNTILQEG